MFYKSQTWLHIKISNFKLELTNFVSRDSEGILTKKCKVLPCSMLFKDFQNSYSLLLPVKNLIYTHGLNPKSSLQSTKVQRTFPLPVSFLKLLDEQFLD